MLVGITPRLYQETILNTAVKSNTMAVLPTGLGKTAIAAMLMTQRLDNYPDSKIMFLAPTKPLAGQHEKSLKKFFPKMKDKIILFTGTIKPEKRQELFDENQIIISTPQGLENDVISRRIKLEEISLLIIDEAHRAVKDYAYVFLAKKYHEKAKHERILALTASPGADQAKILEVCSNLFIDEVEYRSHDDPDVKEYIQEMKQETIHVELTEELLRIHRFLKKAYESKIDEAIKLGYLHGAINNYNKTTLLKVIGALQGKIASGEKEYDVLKSISLVAEALKVEHAIELIETQDINPLHSYMTDLEKQASSGKVKSVKNLVQDLNFRSAKILTEKLIEQKIRHPKLDKIKEITTQHIKHNQKCKIIIFTQFRDTASKIKEVLEEDKISSEIFVGQAKKKNTGLSQKQQKQMLENFSEDTFNCLIATSVGEEGLDIPEVDLVIFYEPIPSAIRTVQRRGRTGRQKEGQVITLITKGTRDEGYKWAAHHKEKRMYQALKNIKNKLHEKNNEEQKTILGSQESVSKTQNKPLADFLSEEEITIKVDYREKGSQVIKELLDLKVNINLESMQLGDYQLSEHVIVEYKTVKDFVDSIIDGRLLSQAKELKQFYKPLIIIEGTDDIYSQRRIHPNAIRGMLAALTIGLRIPLIQTRNAKDTAGLLRQIAKREQSTDEKDWQMHTTKPINDKEIQEYIISSIPDIGPRLAPALLKHFKTIKAIANASLEELQEVELIGKIKAKKIKELMDKEYE
ncbi:DEAD/DEAH box helicase [Candidatus Woesearchaeota archaeon]|nr:DEAD/DEAH box helicase [Candidatus Woesearchaeota archaeon]MCF7901561.1 DEAD/DEAH box helicase [Candidatus Woesearchaeota archaeon]MCF8013327.1 DEAD/DEAH box helicase [Candidatus Woesearchaeota archaeon]